MFQRWTSWEVGTTEPPKLKTLKLLFNFHKATKSQIADTQQSRKHGFNVNECF